MQNPETRTVKLNNVLLNETRATFKAGFTFASGLYTAFWIVDCIYLPEKKWIFLTLRLIHLAFVALLAFYFRKPRSLFAYQIAGVIWAAVASNIISTMIFLSQGASSPYYAGLGLVALLSVFFIPYAPWIQSLALLLIFLPYYGASAVLSVPADRMLILINSAFISGTVLIALIIRRLNFETRSREVDAQVALDQEISHRGEIIREKTEETVKLSRLSNQFSPQVVEAIRNGGMELSAIARRKLIAAIFIDIVNSTERVVRVDKDKVHRVISMFLEDTVRILLKYDITIDKFMGDGILAFSNDPVQHVNFVERAVRAVHEIRERIQSRQDEYEDHWMSALEIRVGVASGFANVGFYGNEKFYQCYTAIGPVVNLACRLSSAAKPNEILITRDVFEALPLNLFDTEFAGKKTLKGFEQDIIKCYTVKGYFELQKNIPGDSSECPSCHKGILFLDTNESGHYVFKCRHCQFVQVNPVETDKTQKAS